MMEEQDKALILKLALKKIAKEEFLSSFSYPKVDADYLKELLEVACKSKDADEVEYAMLLGFSMQLFSEDHAKIVSNLITETWHTSHEDMASVLQDIKDPATVDSLCIAASLELPYLAYDDSFAFAVKCMWALGDIGTKEAIDCLNKLAESDIHAIRENAGHQLARITE